MKTEMIKQCLWVFFSRHSQHWRGEGEGVGEWERGEGAHISRILSLLEEEYYKIGDIDQICSYGLVARMPSILNIFYRTWDNIGTK